MSVVGAQRVHSFANALGVETENQRLLRGVADDNPNAAAAGLGVGILLTGSVGPSAGGAGASASSAVSRSNELVLDTNVVISHGRQYVQSGANAVKSQVTDVELNSLVNAGRIRMPGAAAQIPSVGLPSVNIRINVRGFLTPRASGNFADGIIGGTAIERGSTLVSNDKHLVDAVVKNGGKAVRPK